jgi:hypothetical protein
MKFAEWKNLRMTATISDRDLLVAETEALIVDGELPNMEWLLWSTMMADSATIADYDALDYWREKGWLR